MQKEMKFLQENSTIAIAPYFDGKHSSIILSHQGSFRSKETVERILNCYCLENGSSLKGRMDASREIFEFRKNPPILISQLQGVVGLQVPSFTGMGTMWVLDLNFKIEFSGPGKCKLLYKSGKYLEVPLSAISLRTRRGRALELLYSFCIKRRDTTT